MKITIEFKDINEYLEFKEETAQKEQYINFESVNNTCEELISYRNNTNLIHP